MAGGGHQGLGLSWDSSSSFSFSSSPKLSWVVLCPRPLTAVPVLALLCVHSGHLVPLSLLPFFSHIWLPLGLSIPH